MGQRFGLEIRTAGAADAAGLAALLQDAGHPVPESALAERLDAIRYGHGTALIALEWGPPSGLVVLHWYPVLHSERPVAQITTLLVGPDERRRGIGRQLLKAAAQAARMAGCGVLQLTVPEGAVGLAPFGAAAGFSPEAGSLVRPLRKRS